MIELIFYSLIGGLFSLIGGLFILWRYNLTHKILLPLSSFGAGAFMAAALIDILPEALEQSSEPHPILLAVLIGFLLFFILERYIMKFLRGKHAHNTHSDHTESLPPLLVLGDSIHNLLDGIVIAISYVANPVLGLSTALVIAAHEIPQEIGDFSLLLKQGWKKQWIIVVNVIQSLLTIPGVVIGYYLGQFIEPYLSLFLGLTAGIFIYIAATDIIPEIHHQSGHRYFFRVIIPFIASILLVYIFSNLLHQH